MDLLGKPLCLFNLVSISPPSFSSQVHLQTQQEVKLRMVGMATHVVKTEGFLALYSGLSASLCRQVWASFHLVCKLLLCATSSYMLRQDLCCLFPLFNMIKSVFVHLEPLW